MLLSQLLLSKITYFFDYGQLSGKLKSQLQKRHPATLLKSKDKVTGIKTFKESIT